MQAKSMNNCDFEMHTACAMFTSSPFSDMERHTVGIVPYENTAPNFQLVTNMGNAPLSWGPLKIALEGVMH